MSGLNEARARQAKHEAEVDLKLETFMAHLFHAYKYYNLELRITPLKNEMSSLVDLSKGSLTILSASRNNTSTRFILKPELVEQLNDYLDLSKAKSGLNNVEDLGVRLTDISVLPLRKNAENWLIHLEYNDRSTKYLEFAAIGAQEAHDQIVVDPNLEKVKLVLHAICQDDKLTMKITSSTAYETLCHMGVAIDLDTSIPTI